MSYLSNELAWRQLPPLLTMNSGAAVTAENWRRRRGELLDLMAVNSYGFTPPAPSCVRWEVLEENLHAYANKAVQRLVKLSFDTPKGEFSFPVHFFLPHKAEKPAAFIEINFRSDMPDRYCPAEEIIDEGFALAVFNYQDVIRDSLDGNFDQGLGAMYREAGADRAPDE